MFGATGRADCVRLGGLQCCFLLCGRVVTLRAIYINLKADFELALKVKFIDLKADFELTLKLFLISLKANSR